MKKKVYEILKELGTDVDFEAIKELRKLRKVHQETIADELGLHLQAYQRRENGKVPFTAMELKAVAFILGEPVEFFYTDYEPNPEHKRITAIAAKMQNEGINAEVQKRH